VLARLTSLPHMQKIASFKIRSTSVEDRSETPPQLGRAIDSVRASIYSCFGEVAGSERWCFIDFLHSTESRAKSTLACARKLTGQYRARLARTPGQTCSRGRCRRLHRDVQSSPQTLSLRLRDGGARPIQRGNRGTQVRRPPLVKPEILLNATRAS
jgi:hypothetical protein